MVRKKAVKLLDAWYDGPFRPGDRVWVTFGAHKEVGTVVAARGRLARNGKQLYDVEIYDDPFLETRILGRGEDEITSIPPGVDPEPMPDKSKAIEYLKYGLVGMLRVNCQLVDDQPRAWLRPDVRGNVIYTLRASRGKVGGAPIPFQAVRDRKIVTEKRDQVVAFLQTFGLDRAEAEEIVAFVGVTR